MEKKNTFKLIDGTFSSNESREILHNLFSSKIQFHHIKNESALERFGKEDEIAVKRIPQLSDSLNEILEIIQEAAERGEQLEIKSEVLIRSIKKNA